MEKPITFNNSKGQQLVGILHIPKNIKKGIVMCHGFQLDKAGFHRSFVNLARILERKGCIVLRFDFSCAGDSEGNTEDSSIFHMADDLENAVNLLKKYTNDVSIIGHSLGGIVSVIYASKNKIEKLILWATPLHMKKPELKNKKFFFWKGFKIKLRFLLERNKIDFNKLALKINVPLLIINGEKDEFCDLKCSEKFINDIKSRNKKMAVIKNGDHFFKNKQKELFKETLKWLK